MGIRNILLNGKEDVKPVEPHKKAKGGLPAKYENPEDFEEALNKYFDKCNETNISPTVSGMAYDLGFCDRQSLYDYEKKPEFLHIIKRARLRIEAYLHSALLKGNINTPGAIFTLKYGFGYYDKRLIEELERRLRLPEKTCRTEVEVIDITNN